MSPSRAGAPWFAFHCGSSSNSNGPNGGEAGSAGAAGQGSTEPPFGPPIFFDGLDGGLGDAEGNADAGGGEEVGGCGDSVVQSGEACDDGNIVGGDGCAANCAQLERDYARPTPGQSGDACTTACIRSSVR